MLVGTKLISYGTQIGCYRSTPAKAASTAARAWTSAESISGIDESAVRIPGR